MVDQWKEWLGRPAGMVEGAYESLRGTGTDDGTGNVSYTMTQQRIPPGQRPRRVANWQVFSSNVI